MTKREKQDRDIMFQRLMAKGLTLEELQKLRRISLTLRRWYELECGTENDYGTSFAIERGFRRDGIFVSCPNETECREFGATCKPYLRIAYNDYDGVHRIVHNIIPDRETGALKRLAAIMAPHKRRLTYYLQTDPRGCALYIVPLNTLRSYIKRTDIISKLTYNGVKPSRQYILSACYPSVGIAVY